MRRKDKRDDLCNYHPVGPPLILGKIMGCVVWDLFNKELNGIT